ncbi:MAG: VOC family protein [Meiothermus sp.]
MSVTLDHLVVAAASLGQGAEYIHSVLDVYPVMGGKHVLMGTHNMLLNLGNQTYLEIIAIDPEAPHPGRPRWFGLDEPEVQAQLGKSPRLIHWVARTDDIRASVASSSLDLGEVSEASRGDLRWLITLPKDGKPLGDGLIPTLIEWGAAHPTDSLSGAGCELLGLTGFHPDPEPIGSALKTIGAQDSLRLERTPELRLEARIRTPSGVKLLR